ncbi:hypothetical protein [Spirosoma rhododendri]|uniref:Uncharacterized protein n=1 Tax=Spirosoma rhododendri TaxID=2728024 RepID=A0A7L5DKV5_9BACT|nr:hypothetical protein [Spirosoma rhododendri]QJD77813.1 hypothetical protein HH216_04765 [Spirosoma rhododendri]
MPFENVTTVNNLLRNSIEGIEFLLRNRDNLFYTVAPNSDFMKRAIDVAISLQKLDDDNLVDRFSEEISNSFLLSDDNNKLLRLLNVVSGKIFELWGSLSKYNESNVADENTDKYLSQHDYEILTIIKKYATLTSNKERYDNAYYPIMRVIEELFNESDRINEMKRFSFYDDTQTTLIPSPETFQPIGSDVKLLWNGTNRVLYDLFAQLSLIDVKPGQRLIGNTIKELARFLSEHVEGLPSVETVERELEKMREPQGLEKAKRGRIDLHITKETD